MRELQVRVPAEREAQVLECLQGAACELKNVSRHSDGRVATISTYIHHEECGVVLHELDKIGVGAAYGKVAVLPVLMVKPLAKTHVHLASLVNESTWRVRGRLAIEEMHATVTAGCSASFDYCALVFVAAWIAAVGLATNNAVMIVASMLVSPLMGPILAFCFGTSIRDWNLIKHGLVVEVLGLVVTFTVGFGAGLTVAAWKGVATFNDWPTGEMQARGDPQGLIAGAFFAVPSGAGVALSTTQGGPTAIVGVAIAASLLPPVVNVGMSLAFAIAGARRLDMDAEQFYHIAGISFALYAINVVCIFLVCQLVFYIKDIRNVRKQLSSFKDLPKALPLLDQQPDGGAWRGSQGEARKLDAAEAGAGGAAVVISMDMESGGSSKAVQKAAEHWRAKAKMGASGSLSDSASATGSGNLQGFKLGQAKSP